MRTVGTAAIMLLAQPVLLFICAHVFPGSLRSFWIMAAAFVLAALVAAAALLTSRWSPKEKLIAALVYVVYAVASWPVSALMAVCSTGDCI